MHFKMIKWKPITFIKKTCILDDAAMFTLLIVTLVPALILWHKITLVLPLKD